MLLKLGALNLWRHRVRTALSLGSVVAGVAVLIVGRGFLAGLSENLVRAQIDDLSGHVLVRPAGYPTVGLDHPVDHLLDPEALAPSLDAAGTWTDRLLFAPRLIHRREAMRVRAIGYDPDRDEAVFRRDHARVEGDWPGPDEVLLTVGVARLLRVGVDDRVLLETRTVAGAINALDARVAGVVRWSNPAIDKFGILVPMPLVEDLVRPEGRRSHVAIRIDDRDEADAVASDLRRVLPDTVEVVTWADEVEPMMRLQRVRQRALDLLVFALLGMSASGIANTVLMAAYERIREIGTLRAMGMTEAGVLRLFLVEGALMGTAGALLGAAVGGGIVAWYAHYGLDLSAALEHGAGGNIPISTVLYPELSGPWIGGSMAFGVGVAVLASIYPARVAARMRPADAVRSS